MRTSVLEDNHIALTCAHSLKLAGWIRSDKFENDRNKELEASTTPNNKDGMQGLFYSNRLC